MEIMAGKIEVGDIVVLRGSGKDYKKITDVRRPGFPRNAQGRSYMLSLQSGPHSVMFNEADMVKVK